MKNFEINNISYSMKENGYCFKTENGKTSRISKAAFEAARAEANTGAGEMTEIEKAAMEALNAEQNATNEFTNIGAEEIAAKVEEMVAEGHTAEDEQWETEEREAAEQPKKPAKKPTAKKSRKSKDIAFEMTLSSGRKVTLTEKQVDFIRHIPDTCFYEHGIDSCVWIDVLADEIGGQFAGKPMTVGAMISTLCEKGLGARAKQRVNGHKAVAFDFTAEGKEVAKELGL